MPANERPDNLDEVFRKSAQEYFRKHKDGPAPPESVPQATQRMITVSSFSLIEVDRPDVHHFNELRVKYPSKGRRPGEVVPDAREDGRRDLDFNEPVFEVFILFQSSERQFVVLAGMNGEVGTLGSNPIGDIARH